jgi:hypothetical protein
MALDPHVLALKHPDLRTDLFSLLRRKSGNGEVYIDDPNSKRCLYHQIFGKTRCPYIYDWEEETNSTDGEGEGDVEMITPEDSAAGRMAKLSRKKNN